MGNTSTDEHQTARNNISADDATSKAVLPTLCNEFIALIKETSVAGYVGVMDLTKSGNVVAGRTFEYFIPLFTVAIVYLVIVMVLTSLVGKLERRLRKSER